MFFPGSLCTHSCTLDQRLKRCPSALLDSVHKRHVHKAADGQALNATSICNSALNIVCWLFEHAPNSNLMLTFVKHTQSCHANTTCRIPSQLTPPASDVSLVIAALHRLHSFLADSASASWHSAGH